MGREVGWVGCGRVLGLGTMTGDSVDAVKCLISLGFGGRFTVRSQLSL